jgi:hypothetical protein
MSRAGDFSVLRQADKLHDEGIKVICQLGEAIKNHIVLANA